MPVIETRARSTVLASGARAYSTSGVDPESTAHRRKLPKKPVDGLVALAVTDAEVALEVHV